MAEVEKRDREPRPRPLEWEYAPAPEARDIVRSQRALRALHRRRVGRAADGRVVRDDLARDRGAARGGRARPAPRTSTLAVGAARDAFENGWSALARLRAREVPVPDRADPPGALARARRRSSRSNGGKPIKESRDVDLPLAAAHFFYYAGWADKLEYAFPNRTPRPLGVAGQIIPWNFPLLMLAWKIAPALACGNTVVLKPAETTPLTALLFADVCRQAELPPGVVNIVTGDGSHRRRSSSSTRASTRSRSPARPRSARRSSASSPARGKRLTLELGGKAANIVFDDARSTRRSRGSSTASTSTRATSAAPARACSCRSRSTSRCVAKLKRRLDDAARRRSARQEHRRRRDQLAGAAREDPRARRERGGGGRRDLPAAVPPAREGLLVRADRLHERRAELPDRAGGDLRAGALGADLPHAGGGGREGEQHAVRAVAPASGRRRARASSGWRSGCAPASSGRTRSTASTRPRRSAATRSPASAARAGGTGSSRT